MRTKYEILEIEDCELAVDTTLLQKTGELFFNVNELARQFDRQPGDFLRLASTREYIADIIEDSGNGISRNEDLVRIVQGGKHQGTWLHTELAYEFIGWLSAKHRRAMHKWVDARLEEERCRKVTRDEARVGYTPLTDALKLRYNPQDSWPYIIEADMINVVLTGHTAAAYKRIHSVDTVRDNLCAEEIDRLRTLQEFDTQLVVLDVSLDNRRKQLTKLNNKLLRRLL